MKNLSLTPLEQQVLTSLIDGLYAEPGFSDIDAKDIAQETGIDTKVVRGVISSLVKKGIVDVEQTSTYGAPTYQIIYLREKYWYLHPEWKNN